MHTSTHASSVFLGDLWLMMWQPVLIIFLPLIVLDNNSILPYTTCSKLNRSYQGDNSRVNFFLFVCSYLEPSPLYNIENFLTKRHEKHSMYYMLGF